MNSIETLCHVRSSKDYQKWVVIAVVELEGCKLVSGAYSITGKKSNFSF